MREPFFATYGWHWWVNFANFEGIFYDGRPEALFALLVGKVLSYYYYYYIIIIILLLLLLLLYY